MDLQNEKCVMVIDENLPLGIIANTAAIMGITLGKQMPEVVGADVYDRTGNGHLGIIEFPVPILKGNVEVIKSIREKLYEPEFSDLTVVDFSDLAQECKTYDEFIEKMKDVSETELKYYGVAICGAKKKVNKLTGSMALLRYAPAATKTEFGMVANDVSEYDYDKSFGTYHTGEQMAGFLLELYDSENVVGMVDRESFRFRLADPLFSYAGNSSHNQMRM